MLGAPELQHWTPTGICRSTEEAMAFASAHAKIVLPKLTAHGKWSRYSISGGEHYREWLVTLPHYRFGYYNPHFPHRNVLLRLRCDIREDADGHRVLLTREAESDWAQAFTRARRAGSFGETTSVLGGFASVSKSISRSGLPRSARKSSTKTVAPLASPYLG